MNNKKIQIVLRKINKINISKNYIKWMNDYEVVKYTEQRFKKHTLKDILKFIKEKNKSKNEFLYGIFIKNKKNFNHIGNIKLGPINKGHKSADLSYIIGEKKYWGKNLATSAINLVIKLSKLKFKLKKITAGCYENNIGSIKVLTKNNFRKEGILDSQIIFKKKRIKKYIFGLKI